MLLRFARLQLEIAAAKLGPLGTKDITAATVTKSTGYRNLRAFAAKLSTGKRSRFIEMLEGQIEGTREVLKLARATGEELSMADLEFLIRDEAGGEVTDDPVLAKVAACAASGGGIPGAWDDGGRSYVRCPACTARWWADAIGFKIPNHEPEIPE